MDIDGISEKKIKTDSPKKKVPAENKDLSQDVIGGKILLSWEGETGTLKEKTPKWYIGASAIITLLIAVLIWQRDWFSIIVTLLVSGVLFWYINNTKSSIVKYQITPLGIYAGEHFYQFSELHSFWIVYDEEVKNLYLAFTKKYLPSLIVDIKEVDPILLKTIILRKLPEQEKRGESTIDKIVRMMGL